MSVCKHCNQEMMDFENVTGCTLKTVSFPDGKDEASIPYHHKSDEKWFDRCHDCNAARGQYHHPGCDMERCPRCGEQLISCGCLDG